MTYLDFWERMPASLRPATRKKSAVFLSILFLCIMISDPFLIVLAQSTVDDTSVDYSWELHKERDGRWRYYLHLFVRNRWTKELTANWFSAETVNVTYADGSSEDWRIGSNSTTEQKIPPNQAVAIDVTLTEGGFSRQPRTIFVTLKIHIRENGQTISRSIALTSRINVSLHCEQTFFLREGNEANCTIDQYVTNAALDDFQADFEFPLLLRDKKIKGNVTWESDMNVGQVRSIQRGEYLIFSFVGFVQAKKTQRFTIRYADGNFVRNDTAKYDILGIAPSFIEKQTLVVVFKIPMTRSGILERLLDKLVISRMSPIPSTVFTEGEYMVLVWRDPAALYAAEEKGQLYKVEVMRHYETDSYRICVGILGTVITVSFGLALERLVKRLLRRKSVGKEDEESIQEDPKSILDRRLAKGRIKRQEYEELLRLIERHHPEAKVNQQEAGSE